MYFNVFGEKVSRARYKLMQAARNNRRELIAARLSRRELFKMGLLTGAGYLAPIKGLSARAQEGRKGEDERKDRPEDEAASPPTTPFIQPLHVMPVKRAVERLHPAPTVQPNTSAGEARTRDHQALTLFPPRKFYEVTQEAARTIMSPDLPFQTIWGFDGIAPGPTYHARYGEPILVRNFNRLPHERESDGFGIPSVTTHLHNGHTPSESDGFPCDFFERHHFYDQHYPNVLAGVLSTHRPTGDINEAMSTLWYHDHRVDFTSQNTYKGLLGFFLLFNEFDTGDENTGFHLPSGPFDVPMVFADKVFDDDGKLFFDLFNIDGILGDKFLVNGRIQPFFEVHPRRYRFRWLNTGPSRFFEFFLTDKDNLSARNPFWVIANDGNLLPRPVQVESVRIGVAERMDVIIDFSPYAGKSIFLENRLEQKDGRGPTGNILPAGKGNFVMRFDVVRPPVADHSMDPARITKFYDLPSTAAEPAVTRTFKFDRLNGQWSINGQFMDCNKIRFRVKQNTVERWLLTNLSGDWQHPIHIHLEEHQILTRDRVAAPLVERSRKDVTRLQFNERVELFFRFRDFLGRYPLHCHNMVHEDHAMMLRWEIDTEGDTNRTP